MTDRIEPLLADLTSGEDKRAEEAARLLGELGAAALPVLERLLDRTDEDARWWAVRALGEIDDPAAAPLLKSALHDPAPTVRACAARALIAYPSAKLIPDLIACLQTEDTLLARLAGTALSAAGEPAVLPLIEVMEKGSQLARLEAARALAEIRDPRAIPVFFHAIQDGDSPLVEYWADIGLDNLGIGMTFFSGSE